MLPLLRGWLRMGIILEKMENKKEMRDWLNEFKLSHPFVIAGPCSAETEEQVLKIAHEL